MIICGQVCDMSLTDLVFWATCAAVVGLNTTLLATLAVSGVQIWPPPGRDTWQYRLTWALFGGACVGYLGLRGCLGLEAELVTEGPFAVSRNPGYVGDLILMAGYVILSDSRLAGIVAAGAALWFLGAPLAEEPWLETQYGADYRRYKEQHPRFLGLS